LRRGGSVGSLEAGKLADFAIHDMGDWRELGYFFGRDTAYAVYVGGVRQI
jgi:imidazolonepropionase